MDITCRLVPVISLGQKRGFGPANPLVIGANNAKIRIVPENIKVLSRSKGSGVHKGKEAAFIPGLSPVVRGPDPSLPSVLSLTAKTLGTGQILDTGSPLIHRRH